MVSNGCIRMHNAHAEEIFTLINIGTPMYIRD
ncbi:L,D-transpeptidase [Sporomusa silvacetica]